MGLNTTGTDIAELSGNDVIDRGNEALPEIQTPKSVIALRILAKVEKKLESMGIIRSIAHDITEFARMAIAATPLGYRVARNRYPQLLENFEKISGRKYEFDPRELFSLTLNLLCAQGKFSTEQLKFLEDNDTILKRMFNANIDYKLLESDPIKEMPKVIRWDRLHAKELLDIDLFELLELPEEEFRKKFQKQDKHDGPRGKLKAKKIEFSADRHDRKVTRAMFQKNVLDHEEKLCKRSNNLWKSQVELYFDRPKDIQEHLFEGRVADTHDHFDLYAILEEFTDLYEEYQQAKTSTEKKRIREKVYELDAARKKLLIYLSASILTQNPQYRVRKSVKTYLDHYLTKNIFHITGDDTISPEGYPDIQIKVVTAVLEDPFTRETVQVYLYQGINSDKPEEGKSGVVNIKALYKVVMKDLLLDDKEVKDFFRITVMPVNPQELGKMRKILAATITNPQSLDKGTIIEIKNGKNNKTTSYKDTSITNYDTTISPYVVSHRRMRRGSIRDVDHKGETVHVGPMNLEVRTGTVVDLVPEDRSGEHKAYSRLRMEPVWRKLLSPIHYGKNWVSMTYLRQNEIKASTLDKNDRTLPGFVLVALQKAKLKAAKQGVSLSSITIREIRRAVGRAMQE